MESQAVVENLHGIHGLTYLPNYISAAEETDLLDIIDHKPWSTELRRRMQYYGYRYDTRRRTTGAAGHVDTLPGWLLALAERLRWDGLVAQIPDQSAINEYLPGQGIATHVDCVPCFGDTVLSLSLGSPCVMHFTHTVNTALRIPALLEPRSLLVMRGAARVSAARR